MTNISSLESCVHETLSHDGSKFKCFLFIIVI